MKFGIFLGIVLAGLKDFLAKRDSTQKRKKPKAQKMENELSYKIIGAAIEVQRTLGGPGLLERIYEEALCHELKLRELKFERQLPVRVMYKGVTISDPLFVDILVENKVIVEVKATEKHNTVYDTQVLTYLRLTGKKLGLVINFGNPCVGDGISRVINGL